jgi:hypothetical protein
MTRRRTVDIEAPPLITDAPVQSNGDAIRDLWRDERWDDHFVAHP